MKTLALALLGTTALALAAGPAAAYTATIYDALNNPPPANPGTYSHGWGDPGPGSARWADNFNIGNLDFYSGNVYVTWIGADVIIDLTTNMPRGGSSGYGFADIFFDLQSLGGYGSANAPAWDYGLDINSGAKNDAGSLGFGQNTTTDKSAGKTGPGDPTYVTVRPESNLGPGDRARLVRLTASADWAYSVKDQIEWTKICTDGVDCGTDQTSGRRPEVEILKTAYEAEYAVQTLPGPAPLAYTHRIVLAGVNPDGAWDAFRFFWATGWCANDTVEGYVTRIPVPAALPILVAALAGFAFAGWRQRSATP